MSFGGNRDFGINLIDICDCFGSKVFAESDR